MTEALVQEDRAGRGDVWLRVVLLAASGWALLPFVLSFVLPTVTVSSGQTGVQPRVPLVQHFGLSGTLPAVGMLVAVIAAAGLLRWGRAVRLSTWRLASVTVLVVVALLAGLVAIAFTHLVGLLVVPWGDLLVGALVIASYRYASTDSRTTAVPTAAG